MTTQSKRTVAFALCGSFCSFAAVLPQLRVLTARGWDVLPVLSASAAGLDTRFGTASALRQTLYEVTGHRPLTTLQAVEPLGPQRLAEALIIAPATGTTMALLAAFVGGYITRRLGLPTRARGYDIDAVLHAMGHDKKRAGKRLRFVIPQALGDVVVIDDPGEEVVRRAIGSVVL